MDVGMRPLLIIRSKSLWTPIQFYIIFTFMKGTYGQYTSRYTAELVCHLNVHCERLLSKKNNKMYYAIFDLFKFTNLFLSSSKMKMLFFYAFRWHSCLIFCIFENIYNFGHKLHELYPFDLTSIKMFSLYLILLNGLILYV